MSGTRRWAKGTAAILLAAALAGCGTPAVTHFHTLSSSATPPAATDVGPFAVELLAVSVPREDDQPSIVLRGAGSGVALLDDDQWAAPLGDEIRQALAEEMGARLGTVIHFNAPSGNKPLFRVSVDIRRFDMMPGGSATLEAVWSVEPGDDTDADNGDEARTLSCQSVLSARAGSDLESLIEAQRTSLKTLAALLASAVRRQELGQPAACPPEDDAAGR